ncbi:MAG: sulfatase-like hydrolase/transferase [Candidatus Brocadiia bacterium]
MPDRPKNVIILSSDEMRGDCPGYMGNPDCETPNLDRFAERTVAFRQHYTVFPKCVPARIAMMTGRYCHTDGFRTIYQHLPNDQPDVLATLKRHGYETALFGLNHCWENVYGEDHNAPGSAYVDYHSFTKDYFPHLLEKEWPVPEPGPDAVEEFSLPGDTDYGKRITEPLTFFCDDNRARQAVHYLTEVRDRSRPFFMQLNLSRPHPSYMAPEPFFSMYDREAIAPWPYELPENAPLPLREMRRIRTGHDVPERAFRELQAVYYAMVTKVDDVLGPVLDAITQEGLWEDSVVLFWVDHGDFAGQYGLPEKWDTCMADCLTHVPFMLWDPDLPEGHTVDSLSDHTDVAPTILELLGVEPDWGIHGHSLLPAVEGRPVRRAVFADGGHEEEMWSRFEFSEGGSGKQRTYLECPEAMARTKMVRTDRHKLVMRLVGGNEFYDMREDPYELRNLWGQPEVHETVCDLQERMIEWCLRTDTDRPYQDEVRA